MGTKKLLPGSFPQTAGTRGAPRAPALLQTSSDHPRAALQRSLPFPVSQGGPVQLPGNSQGAALISASFALRFPLRLARVQGAPGSQRPTHTEWMGEELKVLSQLPCSQDTVTGALVPKLLLKGVVRSPRFAPWHAVSNVLGFLPFKNFRFL